MLNKLMMGVALSALALSGATAQTNPSTSATPNKPAMRSPADTGKSSTDMNKSSTDTSKSSTTGASSAATDSSKSAAPAASTVSSSTGAATGEATFVSTQNPDQWLASKFKGTDVVGSDNKKIGDVSDILFDRKGKIEAFVISVGGFLGVGAKDVALAPTAFEVVKGKPGESDKLRLAMSQDQLKQAQNFEPYKAPQATTGAGAARPAGSSGMRPVGAPPPSSSK